jgi:hypothetical protein
VAEDPWITVRLDGLLFNEKSGRGAVMVMLDVVPELPVWAASPV